MKRHRQTRLGLLRVTQREFTKEIRRDLVRLAGKHSIASLQASPSGWFGRYLQGMCYLFRNRDLRIPRSLRKYMEVK